MNPSPQPHHAVVGRVPSRGAVQRTHAGSGDPAYSMAHSAVVGRVPPRDAMQSRSDDRRLPGPSGPGLAPSSSPRRGATTDQRPWRPHHAGSGAPAYSMAHSAVVGRLPPRGALRSRSDDRWLPGPSGPGLAPSFSPRRGATPDHRPWGPRHAGSGDPAYSIAHAAPVGRVPSRGAVPSARVRVRLQP